MLRAPSEILSVKSFHPIYYHLEIQANPKQNWPKITECLTFLSKNVWSKENKVEEPQTSSLWYVPLMLCSRLGEFSINKNKNCVGYPATWWQPKQPKKVSILEFLWSVDSSSTSLVWSHISKFNLKHNLTSTTSKVPFSKTNLKIASSFLTILFRVSLRF